MSDTTFAHILFTFATIGVFSTGYVVVRWIRERWRTRHDKGYDASKWGAF